MTHQGTPTTCSPFIRWAGSKRWLLPHLDFLRGVEFNDYFEPFLGSGSVFFYLDPQGHSYLSDALNPLIQCYKAVRDHPAQVESHIDSWPPDQVTYYELRRTIFVDPVQAAAQFIYLNKLAFNGLYRVNQQGNFNVPYGKPKSTTIVLPGMLAAASNRLRQHTTLQSSDFGVALHKANPKDFVFLDPPYVSGHRENGFVDYNARLFTWLDQERLADSFHDLDARGVYVVSTNADHESIRRLYNGQRIIQLSRYSSMAASSVKRGPSPELLIIGRSLARLMS